MTTMTVTPNAQEQAYDQGWIDRCFEITAVVTTDAYFEGWHAADSYIDALDGMRHGDPHPGPMPENPYTVAPRDI